MKILNQVNARTLWYVPVDEINPNGLDLIPIYAAVTARYKFRIFPSTPEKLYPTGGGVEFGRGSFTIDDRQAIEIVKFVIYSDGLLLDTRHSTDMSDRVLSDILSYASQVHRLTFEPSMIRRKAYLSEVIATTEADMDSVGARFQKFSTLLSDSCDEASGGFFLDTLRFGTDPASTSSVVNFRFERRQGLPFNERRYYSLSPTTTQQHQELLDALEAALIT